MENRGIIRKVDELGRLVIPIELRRQYGIETKTALDIIPTEDGLFLKVTDNNNHVMCSRCDRVLLANIVGDLRYCKLMCADCGTETIIDNRND